jgi:hypothetical protein
VRTQRGAKIFWWPRLAALHICQCTTAPTCVWPAYGACRYCYRRPSEFTSVNAPYYTIYDTRIRYAGFYFVRTPIDPGARGLSKSRCRTPEEYSSLSGVPSARRTGGDRNIQCMGSYQNSTDVTRNSGFTPPARDHRHGARWHELTSSCHDLHVPRRPKIFF